MFVKASYPGPGVKSLAVVAWGSSLASRLMVLRGSWPVKGEPVRGSLPAFGGPARTRRGATAFGGP